MVKCDTNCDTFALARARFMTKRPSLPHLYKRNKVFYCRQEIKSTDGKRRVIRKSLYTSDYYEATALLQRLAETTRTQTCHTRNLNAFHPSFNAPAATVNDILTIMLQKANNCPTETTRKRNTIISLLKTVEISLGTPYYKFHTSKTLRQITQNIIKTDNIKGDTKRKMQRYIIEFAKCGINEHPTAFFPNVYSNLPTIEKTRRTEKTPHLPYTKEQLLSIFDPRHNFFKKHPDMFFICMLGLFTGARINAAATLQYKDIIIQDGLNCIQFVANHAIKQLKTEASERIVPINPQLDGLGFIKFVRNRQQKLCAKDSDFIFPICQTSTGTFNNKIIRHYTKFLTDIGIKSRPGDGYDFHSFRKTASVMMQEAAIPKSYINAIIGWEGDGTMEQSYSNHNLASIAKQMSKFQYTFLKNALKHWKKEQSFHFTSGV